MFSTRAKRSGWWPGGLAFLFSAACASQSSEQSTPEWPKVQMQCFSDISAIDQENQENLLKVQELEQKLASIGRVQLPASRRKEAPATPSASSSAAPQALKPAVPSDHFERGLFAFKRADYDQAVLEYGAAYQSTQNPLVLYNACQGHALGGRPWEALVCYRSFLTKMQKKARERLEVEELSGDLERLLAKPAAEPAQPPSQAAARDSLNRARVAFESGQYDEAIRRYKFLHQVTQDPIFLYDVGQSYQLSGHASEALLFYTAYLSKLAANAPTRGQVESHVGNLQRLMAKPATESGPPPPPGVKVIGAREHFMRASNAISGGRFEEAALEFQAAHDATQDPVVLYNLAQAAQRAGHPADALLAYQAYFERLQPTAPEFADVKKQIADLRKTAPQLSEPVAAAVAPPRPARDPSAAAAREHFMSATKAFESGKYEIAIVEYQAAYKLKHDPLVLYNAGQAYEMTGDYDNALICYQVYLAKLPEGSPDRQDVQRQIAKLQKKKGHKRGHHR